MLGTVAVLLLSTVGLVALGVPSASAAGSTSSAVDPVGHFPVWYQDSAANRVEPCIDPSDANCVLPASEFFDPTQRMVFPSNYPDEFFYALADSDLIQTPGCQGTVPGKASVRLALEGAFINGKPANGDQMVFGRIRVKVTSGLCPNTTYHFKHPFGTEVFTTNAAGAVPANVGTQDVGCLAVTPTSPCDFTKANSSRVFGSAAAGFLRWDPAAGAAPAGYLGDGVTLHTVTGGTNGNGFAILNISNGDIGLSTNQFVVAGKVAGSLTASPSPTDFGGVALDGSTGTKTITVTNLDKSPVTVGATGISGPDAAMFSAAPGGTTACTVGLQLARDAQCTIAATFTPTGPGRRTAALTVASSGGVRSPLSVQLTGSGTNVGDAPAISLASATGDPTLAFGNVRVRTTGTQSLRIRNTGLAPLKVDSVVLDPKNPDSNHYKINGDACTGTFVDPGQSCLVDVQFAPSVVGNHDDDLVITTNDSGSPHTFPITGSGTGGVAAVSSKINDDGFPDILGYGAASAPPAGRPGWR